MSEGKKSGSGKPRRESIKFIPKPVPYRIAQTVTETGKTIAMTKRRVIWRYGWSNSAQAHEVCLKDSLLSGKKVILQDGREVYQSKSSRFTFRHGWEVDGHIYRIEITDVEDLFTIDSIPFSSFEPKPDVFPEQELELSLPDPEPVVSKKILSTKGPEQSVTPVKVQPVQAKSDSFTFDPFSPSQSTKPITDSSSFFDPFSSPSQPSSQSVPPPVADRFDVFSPGRPQPSQKPKFDLFDSEIQPSQSSSNNKPAPSIFDMFDNFPTNPPAAAQTATSFDLFTPSTTSQINPTPMLDLFGMVSNDSIQNQGSDPFHNNYDSLSYSASSGKLTSSDPFATSNSLNHHYISPSSTYDSNAPVLDSPQISFNYYGGGGPSSTADPFADTPQSEAINPFETDIYPVFTSSSSPSMDPFFLSS